MNHPIPAFGILMALCACGPSVPNPRSPLTSTSPDAQPARPSVRSDVLPPQLPAIDMRQLPGAQLWSVQRPGTGRVRIDVVTRRGGDRTYANESLQALLFTLAETLEMRLPGYRVGTNLEAEALSFGVTVRSEDAAIAIQAIAQVLDGPLDDAVARRKMRVDQQSRPRVPDALMLRFYEGPSEPRVITSAQALSECRDERFASSDRLVTLVGDFDSSLAFAAAGESFASPREYPRLSPPALHIIQPEETLVVFWGRYFEAGLSFALPRERHEDSRALRLLISLMNDQLDIMPSDHAGARAPSVQTYRATTTRTRVAGMTVRGVVEHREALLVALFRHARSFTAGPVTSDAITRAREQIWMRVQSNLESSPDAFLGAAFLLGLTPAELAAQYEAPITPEDLLAVARRYLTPERMIVHVSTPSQIPHTSVVREQHVFRLVETAP